jgi:nucleoside-diphosphate-sugar epimerase
MIPGSGGEASIVQPHWAHVSTWFVIGCGYTGTALVRMLVSRGDTVTLTRRDAAVAEAQGRELGARGLGADLGDPASLAALAIPPDAIVVCLAPPAADPAGEIRNLIDAAPGARLVYVSSTGVYGPGHGAVVDEQWPLAPSTAAGRARVAAEAALAGNWVALRPAGIYGPGRGMIERIRAGSFRIVGDGSARVCRIHVDDLVAAILAAAASDITGPINIADDDPSPIGEAADAIAARLGAPVPPRVPVASVDPEVAGMLTANRRIDNTRMKRDLGVVLRVPSWRDHLNTVAG